jgi:ankyrin repeat protein
MSYELQKKRHSGISVTIFFVFIHSIIPSFHHSIFVKKHKNINTILYIPNHIHTIQMDTEYKQEQFIIALSNRQHEIVVHLLENNQTQTSNEGGVDVQKKDIYGAYPLYWAVWSGDNRCIQSLVEAGADVNVSNNSDDSPLLTAVSRGHVHCLPVLLALGADVNKRNVHGWTALYWAASCGNDACIEVLLAAGADATICDIHGRTPLVMAKTHDKTKCVELLMMSNTQCKTIDTVTRDINDTIQAIEEANDDAIEEATTPTI